MSRGKYSPKTQKSCKVCKELFLPNSAKQTICSDECRKVYYSSKGSNKTYVNGVYIHTGYNQKGKNNNNYRHGITTKENNYQNKVGKRCERCGSKRNLLVHHKDEDRTNYSEDNLETLSRDVIRYIIVNETLLADTSVLKV
jgi:hypothetical protein